jgi:hypothetical protein
MWIVMFSNSSYRLTEKPIGQKNFIFFENFDNISKYDTDANE